MRGWAHALLALSMALPVHAQLPIQTPPAPEVPAGSTSGIVPAGTPVRLMIVKEITSRTAQIGDRFKLRVDEPVFINGAPVIPVGTAAWGEIVSVKKNGAVGKGGQIGARLLHVDLPAGRLPLRGEPTDRGEGNGAGVALALVGFGLFGLLTGGDSARLKAGDRFTGYVDGPMLPTAPSEGQILEVTAQAAGEAR